ncbi:MAG: amidohydrolase family protein [Halieaceae bacterium]
MSQALRSTARLLLLSISLTAGLTAMAEVTVIENVTLIDGNGGQVVKPAWVSIANGKITAVESSAPRDIPASATRINGAGKYLLPGFIDTNVHASVYGNSRRRETAVKYARRNHELAEEFAQRQLKFGVTTIRDSYGSLLPLIQVRDAIERGEIIGPRMLVAGNIVGWGGPFSLTFSLMKESDLTLFQEQWNDLIAQGAGEELMDMGPEDLRVAINAYLDKGPNFIKYGGTSHFRYPSLIGFSPRAQRVIVEETHKRGLVAETHATSAEALRMAVEAGIDFIQHPEILSSPYPEDLIAMIVERDVICGLRSNTLAGEPWRQHVKRRQAAIKLLADAIPPATSAERRRRETLRGDLYELERENAERLIAAGCRVTIATDNYQGRAPEFRREPKLAIQEAGMGSLLAIEGLTDLGMTAMQAIVAGTRNGAIAARGLEQFGTIEVGKSADLVLLDANPLRDISNIRRQSLVMARGRVIDTRALPRQRIFYVETGFPK